MPPELQSPPPVNDTTRGIDWAYVIDHFAFFTGVLTAIAFVFAMIALSSYIAVFGTQFIWLIEYPDVIKVGLVFAGTTAASLAIFDGWVRAAYGVFSQKQPYKTIPFWIVVGLVTLWYLLLFWSDYSSADPHWKYHAYSLASLGTFAIIVVRVGQIAPFWRSTTLVNAMHYFVALALAVGLFAATYGEFRKGFGDYSTTVVTKDKIFFDVEIIEMLSRYTVLYDRSVFAVIRTDDISKVSFPAVPLHESRPTEWDR